jgi:DNA-binding MarR family transcriptional regulator
MQSDYVDAAVEGWAREWPRLETSAFEVMSRLERVARHLERRTTDALASSRLSTRDLDVLGALRRAGAPFGLPATQLAQAAMLTSGGMTGEADRLAKAGLVARRPDPQDRRAVLVTLTPEGRAVAERAVKTYLQTAEEVLGILEDEERAALVELLRKLLVALEGPDLPGKPARPHSAAPAAKGAKGGQGVKPAAAPTVRHRFEQDT